jgi:hypothetical protein
MMMLAAVWWIRFEPLPAPLRNNYIPYRYDNRLSSRSRYQLLAIRIPYLIQAYSDTATAARLTRICRGNEVIIPQGDNSPATTIVSQEEELRDTWRIGNRKLRKSRGECLALALCCKAA